MSQCNLFQRRRLHNGSISINRYNREGRRKSTFITREFFLKLSFTFILRHEGILYCFSKTLGLRFSFSSALNINGILTSSRIISALIALIKAEKCLNYFVSVKNTGKRQE